MKHASLLIALCVLFGLTAYAQSTTTVEKNAKRITITTKKVDENGKTITETYIAEGDEPEEILKGMAINPETIQRMDVTNPEHAQGERLFLIRQAGDKMSIEGTLEENVERVIVDEQIDDNNKIEKVIIINKDNGVKGKECYRIQTYGDHPVRAWGMGDHGKSNCAALGVYVNTSETGGSKINSVLENGGAMAAGMKEGDVITRIDEFEVNDFAGLHLALSHFQPGDVVTVRFQREGKSQRAKVELKDWKDLPGHEWRARTDCGTPAEIVDAPVVEETEVDDPSGVPVLELQNTTIFPNPTEGLFALSFNSQPGPLTVTVTDVNGKMVYQDKHDNKYGQYKKEIDLKGLPQGNYIISITQDNKVFTAQVSKQ